MALLMCPTVYEIIILIGPVKCSLGDLDDEWGVRERQILEVGSVLIASVRKYRNGREEKH